MPASSAAPMPGMVNAFSADTRVTLWFTQWVTKTPTAYAFTLIFLFALGMFNRFLSALKSQLERRWDKVTDRGHTNTSLHHDAQEELEPLSPMTRTEHEVAIEKVDKRRRRRFWVPNAPWSAKRDGVRAMFEFTRAVIGYILMLAVMTYNIGFFFAVTGSVLLGELVFGRYTQSSHGWQEGGCHE
ncbi:hypothetical protein CC80DRAFT_414608 [Byssothecium circinans]|uniref:Copper transport protein n=1 Tax=Byssothecium circinans TaxID=147558 RepID=A0A6A5TUE5_9PLEO|nr:hypothetical protein CC80DRAFT_414608 [Byssothecium circinans]